MKIFGNFSDKHKRMLVIAGCSALCVALVVVIGARFQSKAQGNDAISSSNSVSSAVTPSPDSGTAGTTAEDKTVTAQANTTSSSADNTQTDQSTQSLQSEVTKPAAPPDSEVKNSSKPPSSSTNSKSSTSSTTQGGSKNSQGQIYFPGFGYVSDDGANSGTTVGNSGDQLTGNKVGQMN